MLIILLGFTYAERTPPPPALWKKKYQKERETKKEKKIEKKKDNFELNVGFQIWTNFFIN